MKFKKRPEGAGPGIGAPASYSDPAGIRAERAYNAGEVLVVLPELKGLHERLHVKVLGMRGGLIHVSALYPIFTSPTERLVSAGEEFEVARDEVITVFVQG